MTAPRRLLVALPDRISDWIAKGEIVDRYFNPMDLFDEVHVLLTNDDRPDPAALGRMAGSATVEVHNLPAPRWLFAATLGWQPELLRPWVRKARAIGRVVRPNLVRCHGVRPNLLAGVEIGADVGAPVVVSIHSNPDVDQLRGRRATTPVARVAGWLAQRFERHALRRADLVLPVYEPIVGYLERLGVHRYEVAYNVVGHTVRPKEHWDLEDGVLRVVNVARQEAGEKDPRPIIEATAAVPRARLAVVGDGPLHDDVVAAVAASGAADRIRIVRALPNAEVLDLLAESDVFAYRAENFELSKGCIEAALTGLALVVNDRGGEPAPELVGDHVWLVDGSAGAYRTAFETLFSDGAAREALGRAALARARRDWGPERTEARFAELYRSLLGP